MLGLEAGLLQGVEQLSERPRGFDGNFRAVWVLTHGCRMMPTTPVVTPAFAFGVSGESWL